MTSRGQTLDRIFVILNRLNEGSIGNIFPEYEVLAYKIVDGRLLKDTQTHTQTDTTKNMIVAHPRWATIIKKQAT